MTLAYLEPSYIEDELQKGEQRKLKVADEAVIQLAASYQTRQHEYVHRYCRYLHSPSTSSPASEAVSDVQDTLSPLNSRPVTRPIRRGVLIPLPLPFPLSLPPLPSPFLPSLLFPPLPSL